MKEFITIFGYLTLFYFSTLLFRAKYCSQTFTVRGWVDNIYKNERLK